MWILWSCSLYGGCGLQATVGHPDGDGRLWIFERIWASCIASCTGETCHESPQNRYLTAMIKDDDYVNLSRAAVKFE